MQSDRPHYTAYNTSSPPLPTTRFRHHQHHAVPSEPPGYSTALQYGILPCTPLRTQSSLSSWEDGAILPPCPFQLTPSSLTMISGAAHASSSPFSSMCFDVIFRPQSEQQQLRQSSVRVDVAQHQSPAPRLYTALSSRSHWIDGQFEQGHHTNQETSPSSIERRGSSFPAWIQRDHAAGSTDGRLMYDGSDSGLCSTITLDDSTHTAFTSPCPSSFACLSSGLDGGGTGTHCVNSPFSAHSLLFDNFERPSDIHASKQESSPDSDTAINSSSVCITAKHADDDTTRSRRRKKQIGSEEAVHDRSRQRLCESTLLNMSIEQLERDGWQSTWPHHHQSRANKRKKSVATSERKGKNEISVHRVVDDSTRILSGSSLSVSKDTSTRYPDEAEQHRLFFEVKQRIQAIPEAGDPARFQENGRCLVACDACKRRKMRCTNEFPHCSSCLKRGIQCTYPVKARTRGRTKASGGATKCEWIKRCASPSALSESHPHLGNHASESSALDVVGSQSRLDLSIGTSSLAEICSHFPHSTYGDPVSLMASSVADLPPSYSSGDAMSAAAEPNVKAPSRKRAKREPVERRSRLGKASSTSLRAQGRQSAQIRQ